MLKKNPNIKNKRDNTIGIMIFLLFIIKFFMIKKFLWLLFNYIRIGKKLIDKLSTL